MENQLECRGLRKEDIELVSFFIKSLQKEAESPEEVFSLWVSPLRQESLEHYLATNWCFGCFKMGALQGVVLQQPLLFWNGLTQVLWVEAVAAIDFDVKKSLLELSYKTAREKHLQAMAFSKHENWTEELNLVGLTPQIGKNSIIVKTASWG